MQPAIPADPGCGLTIMAIMSIMPMMAVKQLPAAAGPGLAMGGRRMDRMNVVELRAALADVLNRAEYAGERIVVHRRGKDAAAIIPIEDLRLFERLLAEAEDREDVADARTALAELGGRIAYEDFRRRKGPSDGQAERPRARGRRASRAAKAAVHD